jgi:transketolase
MLNERNGVKTITVIKMKTANGKINNILVIRLRNGESMMKSIKHACEENGIKNAVIINMTGSLDGACFSVPVKELSKKNGISGLTTQLEGPVELLTAQGEIRHKDDGELSIHMHGTFADWKGIAHGGNIEGEENKVLFTLNIFIGVKVRFLMMKEIIDLCEKAREIRKDIMEIAYKAGGPSHEGPAMSCTDILTALYFKIMKIDPANPQWEERDRLVLSKGHACPALYSALAERGYFDKSLLYTVRRINSKLQGHPDMNKTPGIDMTSGSLGNGLSTGLGIALALRIKRINSNVFVILGDGELQEGENWEAAMAAPNFAIDNLIAIVDYNHLQSGGSTDRTLSLEPLHAKWEAFGWKVFEMNGHNMEDIVNKLEMAVSFQGRPTVLIAHTIKGKGVSYMENNHIWHGKIPTQAEYEQALIELNN